MRDGSTRPAAGQPGASFAVHSDNGNGRAPIADRLPPQNLEAERSVLGSVLLDNDVLPDVVPILGVPDFYRDVHQAIYQAIRDLHDRGEGIDAVTLADELIRRGQFDKIGGDQTLREIVDAVPHAANARYYASIVREKSIGRQVIDFATGLLRDGYSNRYTAPELLERARAGVERIDMSGTGRPASAYVYGKFGDPIPCASNTRAWLALNRPADHVQYDRFRQAILLGGDPLCDRAVIDLTMEIEASLQAPWSQEHVRSALVHLAHQRPFSSLVRWLESLRWDGVGRVDAFFPDRYGGEDSEYSRECSRIFFLSAVARAYEPGCQADVMPVLIGKQGVFKSTGMAALCPDPDWFADDLGSDLFAGKAAEGLQGKWLFEFSEFARINRSTLDVVKSFLTRRVDHYRPPYGRLAQDFPRSCVFFGTTNAEQPLQDVENRRFLPIRVVAGDVPGIEAARDQLWAEAVVRYKAGEAWWTTRSNLLEETRSNLELARSEDAWESILRERLDGVARITMAEAANWLGIQPDRLGKSEQTRIGTALTAIGFVWRKGPRPLRLPYYERSNLDPESEVGPEVGPGWTTPIF